MSDAKLLKLVDPPAHIITDYPPPELVMALDGGFARRVERFKSETGATAKLLEALGRESNFYDADNEPSDLLRKGDQHPSLSPLPSVRPNLGPQSAGPPYAFVWPWSAQQGDPVIQMTTDGASGNIGAHAYSNSNACSGSVWIVQGHYFQPTGHSATISALPSLHYDWFNLSILFGGCHSDGAIGLFIGAYDDQWNWLGPVVDVPAGNLWSQSGTSSDDRSTSGYPLTATVGNLQPTFHYAVGVKIGVDISAAGGIGLPGTGSAEAFVSIQLPAITWTT